MQSGEQILCVLIGNFTNIMLLETVKTEVFFSVYENFHKASEVVMYKSLLLLSLVCVHSQTLHFQFWEFFLAQKRYLWSPYRILFWKRYHWGPVMFQLLHCQEPRSTQLFMTSLIQGVLFSSLADSGYALKLNQFSFSLCIFVKFDSFMTVCYATNIVLGTCSLSGSCKLK